MNVSVTKFSVETDAKLWIVWTSVMIVLRTAPTRLWSKKPSENSCRRWKIRTRRSLATDWPKLSVQ